MSTMSAMILKDTNLFESASVPKPEIQNSDDILIRVLVCKVLDLKPIVTHMLPMEKVGEGIELMRIGKCLKIILKIP